MIMHLGITFPTFYFNEISSSSGYDYDPESYYSLTLFFSLISDIIAIALGRAN